MTWPEAVVCVVQIVSVTFLAWALVVAHRNHLRYTKDE